MSLFDRMYEKPGKGVPEDAPEKKGFMLYLDILIHKLSKFFTINLLYASLSIVWIALLIMIGRVILDTTHLLDNITSALASPDTGADVETLRGKTAIQLQTFFGVSLFVLWGSGPASAAYSYIIRCFVGRMPVFVISDWFDKFKENFKQGIFAAAIDLIMLIILINAIIFYHHHYVQTRNLIFLVMMYLIISIMLIYTMMHPYIYQFMVTFKLRLRDIYKNAFLLGIAKLPGNFLMLVLNFFVMFLLFAFLTPYAATVIMLIFGLCVSRYPSEFYASRVISRLILEKKEFLIKNNKL